MMQSSTPNEHCPGLASRSSFMFNAHLNRRFTCELWVNTVFGCTQFYALRTLEQTSDVSFGCTQACCKIMAFCKERMTSRLMLLLKGSHNFLFRGGSWEQRGPLFVTELQRDKIPKLPLREREWRRTILSYPIPKNPKFQTFFLEKENGGILSGGQRHSNQVFKEVAELSDTKQQKGHNRAIQSDGWLPRAKTTNAGNSGG